MPYVPQIDGVRAVAILMVLAAHLGAGSIIPGGLGVTLFFFISGYLITSLMIQEFARLGTVDVRNFYIRRFLRLAPALLTMVLVVSTIFALLAMPITGGRIAAAALYFMNYYGIVHPGPMTPFDPMWSLAVEEHYYLVFPWLFILGWKSPRHFLLFLGAVILAVLTWRCWLVFEAHASEARTYTSSDTRIDSILFGAVLAILLDRWPIIAARWLEKLALVGATILLATLLIRNGEFRETIRYSLQGLAFIPIFFCAVYSNRFMFARRFLSSPPLILIGRLSYSLYLWHFAVLMLTQPLKENIIFFIAVNLSADILLSALSYFLIELKFINLRHAFEARRHLASRATIVGTDGVV